MTKLETSTWEDKRTDETREVENFLRKAGFERVDSYRYNSASIRVRVIDSRFEGLSREKRDAMVEPCLDRLPEPTQADIMSLLTLAPSELEESPRTIRQFLLNAEFDHPSPSEL